MKLYDYIRAENRFDLLLEWDREKNADLDPAALASQSRQRVWWVCARGHHWQASLAARVGNRESCPYCAGQKPIPGETDLAALRPEVAALWDREENGSLTPRDVMPASHRRVWWRCNRGHTWQAPVFSLSSGTGCPYCAGYRAIPGETDLATTDPALLSEWDYERNAVTPRELSRGSHKRVWWRCPEGHSYEQVVFSRAAGTGCPYCAGKKVLSGFNDLTVTDPALAAEWDAAKNGCGAETVNRGSHKLVWWRCPEGHSYQSGIYARAAGNGCPYCAGRRVLPGFNDLATTHPRLVREWDAARNGALTPERVSRGCNRKVWWRCSYGHVWQAAVFSRTRERASGCPVCAGTVRLRPRYRPRRAVEYASPP